MKKQNFKNLVWFKKDLRTTDHRPLYEALNSGLSLAVFIIENRWLEMPEGSCIHKQFLKDALIKLQIDLQKLGVPLIVKQGSANEVLTDLNVKYNFKNIYSHEETGLNWTYQRDLQVKTWVQENSVNWFEYKQFAVVRGLKNRDLWNKFRSKIIERPLIPNPPQQKIENVESYEFNLLSIDKVHRNNLLSLGGSGQATKVLGSFFSTRGQCYYKELSSPNTAFKSCSRLSPYITWGNISITEIHHSILAQKKTLSLKGEQQSKAWYRSLLAFESRLWWHCHFIQKLESEPEIEFQNINRAFDGMREETFNKNFFEAWKKGETGFPIVDACMRALIKNGWINFRMRAMLVSFATFQLWLDWKKISSHLAQHFIDFEPGIHFSQLQMQSGVTGINSIRIYSPAKQTIDRDPNGTFIRQHCPELQSLDVKHLANISDTPPMILKMMNVELGKSYPNPIVDSKVAYDNAKQTIYMWRKKESVISEAKKVYLKHGSRKHKKFPDQERKIF